MRENRTCGSEGGEAQSLPYPYHSPARALPNKHCIKQDHRLALSTVPWERVASRPPCK